MILPGTETLAPVPAGTIEDHHGMRIVGDLAADLAEMSAVGREPPSTIRSIRVIFPHGHDNSDRLVRLDL